MNMKIMTIITIAMAKPITTVSKKLMAFVLWSLFSIFVGPENKAIF